MRRSFRTSAQPTTTLQRLPIFLPPKSAPCSVVNDTQAHSPLLSCANRHAHPGSSTSRPRNEFNGQCQLDLPLGQQALPTLAFVLVVLLHAGMRSVSPGLPRVQSSMAPHYHSDPHASTSAPRSRTRGVRLAYHPPQPLRRERAPWAMHLAASPRIPAVEPRKFESTTLAACRDKARNNAPQNASRGRTVARGEERGEDDGTSATCARSLRRIRAVEHASTCKSESTNLISATTRRSGRRPSTCAPCARARWGCGTDASRVRQQGTHGALHLHAHIVHDPRPDPGDVRAHGAVRVPPGGVEVAPGEEGTERSEGGSVAGMECAGCGRCGRERGGDAGGGSVGCMNVAGGTGDVRELMYRLVATAGLLREERECERGRRARIDNQRGIGAEGRSALLCGLSERDARFRIEDQWRASAGREEGGSPPFGAALAGA
ncbi:hypothetical protein B0H11DRAFT_2375629 [Mycena galericulata]|nr:hypothetical protein B0H11DRAFT_2375629 [Mycena galericulata]